MKVLVVVDMQNDFISGSLGTPEAQAIVDNVVHKIDTFDGDMICTTKDTHGDDYLDTQEGRLLPVKHCKLYTDGWNLHSDVDAALVRQSGKTSMISQEFMKTSFGSPEMGDHLRLMDRREHITEVVLVGLCTDICVISNAMLLKAFLPETTITVDASCCAGVTPESHQRALEAMKVCQINVVGGEIAAGDELGSKGSEEMSGWINTDNKLPDRDGVYLITSEDSKHVETARFIFEDKEFVQFSTIGEQIIVTECVTHWMLPPYVPLG